MSRFYVSIFVGVLPLVCMLASLYADEHGSATEPQIAIAYGVTDLPVWRLDEGQPQFDATVVIAHLRNHVDAATHISSSAEHKAIVVIASERGHDVVRRVMFQLWTFGGDIGTRLEQKIANARVSNQRVLLLATDPNSAAVKRFFDVQFSDDHRQLQESLRNYIVQCVPSDKRDLLTKLGVTVPRGQEAALAVLDNEGEVAAQAAFADLELNDKGLEAGLVEFLESHQPEFTDAREVVSSGYEQAGREQKRVLLLLSGPNCGPCLELARFFEVQHELITQDYVCVKLDTRMPHASDVIEGIRFETQGPVPWMAVLDADGDVLATSDGPDGNIGYPRSEQSKDHFQKMLSTTSQRLTIDDLAAIMDGLGPTIELGSAPAPTAPK